MTKPVKFPPKLKKGATITFDGWLYRIVDVKHNGMAGCEMIIQPIRKLKKGER